VEPLEDRLCPSSYTITNLGTLGGTTTSGASAINRVGQVVGQAATVVNDYRFDHAFLWTPGATNGVPSNPQMQDLGTLPGLPQSNATALNDAGQVVGTAALTDGSHPHGVFWSGGTMTDMGSLSGLPGTGTVSVATVSVGALPSTQAVQTVTFGGTITGGTFNLGLLSANTEDITWSAAIPWSPDPTVLAANIQAGLSPLAPVTVVSTSSIAYTVTFSNPGPEPTMYANSLSSTVPLAVNNAGQVVGQSGGPYFSFGRAFLWQNGTLTDLNSPTLLPPNSGWVLSSATGINDSQQVVGYGYYNGSTSYHAFLWTLGVGAPTDLGVFAVQNAPSQAYAVNQSGQAAGASGSSGALWSNGSTTTLAPLSGDPVSIAGALNDASKGQVVGCSEAVGPFGLIQPVAAELWQNGAAIDLTAQINTRKTGWSSLIVANGINDAGWIVGTGDWTLTGVISGEVQQPFLMIPPRAASQIALTSSAPTAAYGAVVTFTVTVSPVAPGTGTPTGTVTFKDGNVVLATVNLVNGVAVFQTSLLSKGKHKITASYSGDVAFDSITAPVLTETIG
jgi:probable HAF family extracellular repeat protein